MLILQLVSLKKKKICDMNRKYIKG